ncbi:MAG: hypothetical protein CMF12_13995 [Idiomarina sp.]|uniref:hypothetical protein n=1 Tax=Idiomarina sp. TaxID=1874361 RepID=UPI000C3D75A6|nr:hypothetical protein [Idiomarina sp.]MBT43618.1 hypothetical protein [Idiomarina sp.]
MKEKLLRLFKSFTHVLLVGLFTNAVLNDYSLAAVLILWYLLFTCLVISVIAERRILKTSRSVLFHSMLAETFFTLVLMNIVLILTNSYGVTLAVLGALTVLVLITLLLFTVFSKK